MNIRWNLDEFRQNLEDTSYKNLDKFRPNLDKI